MSVTRERLKCTCKMVLKSRMEIYFLGMTFTVCKKNGHPNGLQITDRSFEVPLQGVIDHAVSRIFDGHSQGISKHK